MKTYRTFVKMIIIIILITLILPSKIIAVDFNDVYENEWYYKDIQELSNKGIVKGYTDGTFKPRNNVTYSEALSMTLQVNGIDTSEIRGGWEIGVKKKGKEKGLIDKNYNGKEEINRLNVAEMIVGLMDIEYISSNIFKDTDNKSVRYLYNINIINGVEERGGAYVLKHKIELGGIL